MELSLSWEATSFPATQEVPNILWNPKVVYHALSVSVTWSATARYYQMYKIFEQQFQNLK
jgi:hypothetical protein